MDDPRWLRLITIGLVLAALAVGYFLLTGGFSVRKSQVNQAAKTPAPQAQVNSAVSATPLPTPSRVPSTSPTPTPTPSPKASPSAYNAIVNRDQASLQTLPRTGFPTGLLVVLSLSAIISGWGLRRFPH